jgi:hypothetical protein
MVAGSDRAADAWRDEYRIDGTEELTPCIGRVAKVVEIGGAGPKAWWSGSGGEVKVGG